MRSADCPGGAAYTVERKSDATGEVLSERYALCAGCTAELMQRWENIGGTTTSRLLLTVPEADLVVRTKAARQPVPLGLLNEAKHVLSYVHDTAVVIVYGLLTYVHGAPDPALARLIAQEEELERKFAEAQEGRSWA